MTLASLDSIARAARRAVETWHDPSETRSPSAGRCKVAACYLYLNLEAAGYIPRVIAGTVRCDRPDPDAPDWIAAAGHLDAAHYWVAVGDIVLDVTADQFNDRLDTDRFPTVVVAPAQELERHTASTTVEPYIAPDGDWAQAFRRAPRNW